MLPHKRFLQSAPQRPGTAWECFRINAFWHLGDGGDQRCRTRLCESFSERSLAIGAQIAKSVYAEAYFDDPTSLAKASPKPRQSLTKASPRPRQPVGLPRRPKPFIAWRSHQPPEAAETLYSTEIPPASGKPRPSLPRRPKPFIAWRSHPPRESLGQASRGGRNPL